MEYNMSMATELFKQSPLRKVDRAKLYWLADQEIKQKTETWVDIIRNTKGEDQDFIRAINKIPMKAKISLPDTYKPCEIHCKQCNIVFSNIDWIPLCLDCTIKNLTLIQTIVNVLIVLAIHTPPGSCGMELDYRDVFDSFRDDPTLNENKESVLIAIYYFLDNQSQIKKLFKGYYGY